MKVLFLHTDFSIHWRGRLNALSLYFAEQNIEFSAIEIANKNTTYSEIDELTARGNTYQPECLFPGVDLDTISKPKLKSNIRKVLNRENPDVVFAGAIAFYSGAQAVAWGVEKRKPVVIFDNARLEDIPRSKIVDYIKEAVYDNVDAILCPAKPWNRTFRYFGFHPEQIFYGLNVTDNSFFKDHPGESLPLEIRKRFVMVGRQVPKKNIHFLLNAWKEINKKAPGHGYTLELVGNGPEHENLVRKVKQDKIMSVEFTGFLSQEGLRDLYHRASALILPSRHGETWGMVVNEAMASGLPVIVSSECGCASSLVDHHKNGYVFDPHTQAELIDVLKEFILLPSSEKENMGKHSEQKIQKWGTDLFCKEVLRAADYVTSREKRTGSAISKGITKVWYGRYRPT